MQRGTDSREICSRHALGGVRMGTPALTTRGLKEADFVRIADFVDRSIKITEKVRAKWYSRFSCYSRRIKSYSNTSQSMLAAPSVRLHCVMRVCRHAAVGDSGWGG